MWKQVEDKKELTQRAINNAGHDLIDGEVKPHEDVSRINPVNLRS